MSVSCGGFPLELRDRWRGLAEIAAQATGAAAAAVVRLDGEAVVTLAAASCDDAPGAFLEAPALSLPIRGPDGAPFAALRLFGPAPRPWPPAQVRLLERLCEGAEAELALAAARAGPLAEAAGEGLGLLAENLVDGFFVHDQQGRILEVNGLACRNLGYSRAELLGMRIWETATASREELQPLWDNAEPGGAFCVRLQYRRKDGVTFPADIRVSCLQAGGRRLFLTTARNIATRIDPAALKPLDEALDRRTVERARHTELLQAVMDGAADAIFIKDLDGRYLLVNRAAERLFRHPAGDVLGRTAADLFGPDNGRQIRELEQGVLQSGVSSTVEETLYAAGREYTFLATRSPYWNAAGEPAGLIGILHDITQMRRAGRALRDSEARWQFAVEGAGDGIWDWDLGSGRVFYSRRWKAMLGHAEDEVGDSVEEWSGRVHPDDLPRCWAEVQRHFAGETADFTLEHRMRARDGAWRWILNRGKAVERDDAGRPARVIGAHTDITARKAAEAELQLQSERLLLATEAGRLGVWDNNLDADTLICDARWFKIFGLPPLSPEETARAFADSVHPDDVEWMARGRAETLASGRPVLAREFRIRRPGGEVRWVASAARLIERSETGPRRLVGVVRDITEEREAAEALRAAKEAAEAAERAKSEFLATMSHEIRTPMNTVIGMTRLTLNSELTPKQRNYLEKIEAAAQTLLAIINDILDFSKIEAGGLQLEDAEFTLEAVLDSMSAMTAAPAEEKGLEIVYAVAPGVPRRLRGDPLRLGQVLTNLVSNAVKFTQAGEVVVSIAPDVLEDGEAALRFSVRDTGIGLGPGQAAGLFRRFSQADAATSRRYGGTGLGLAISKQLVEMMGGRIWVESRPGEGATFSFTVKAVAPKAEISPAPARRPPGRLAGRRVLVVDDNASAREILSEMVRSFGMRAETADGGARALEVLQAASQKGEPFDLVLMDWRMPGMDGMETARRIRAEQALARLPAVLMVTAYGREEVMKGAERIGLQGVLIKPVTDSVMFNTLQDVLLARSRGRPGGETRRKAAVRRGAAPEAQALSALGGLRVLVVDDNALNREVASDFLEAVGIRAETAASGAEALERLGQAAYDAVLMDVHMPGMDGLAAVREIRRRPAWARLPVIALTAQARVEDRAASLQAGMTAHLTKPIDEAALYRTLVRVLDAPAGTVPTPRAAAAPTAASPLAASPLAASQFGGARLGFDPAAAARRFGGDPARLERVAEGFLRDFEGAGARFEAEAQAGAMAAAAALAHAVRGAAGYLEAGALCTVAEQAEAAARGGEAEAVRAYAPIFRNLLDGLLRQLRAHLAARGGGAGAGAGAAGATADAGAVLALAAEAAPLVARGDYAAQALLDRLCALLAGHPRADLAERARARFEDLELEAAQAALAALAALADRLAPAAPAEGEAP